MLKVLVVEPMKKPYMKEIPEGLEYLQGEVDGLIQVLYPFEEPVCIICNDEGKLLGMDFNRALEDENGNVYDYIAGTFLIAGIGDEDFVSLRDEYIHKFSEKYKYVEMLAPAWCEYILSYAKVREINDGTVILYMEEEA